MTTPAFRDPLLAGAVVPQILRLAAPSVTGLLAWTLSLIYDGWIIGRLGTAALAGAAMVLPLSMFMVQCSRAALGGAIAGAVARAIGRGDAAGARSRAFHGVAIEAGIGLAFTLAGLLGGPSLYRLLGGEGEALAAAEAYALPIFGGAIATWVMNALGGVVSGTGNLRLPAATMVAASLAHLLLCPALVFGWGPLPAMGVAGAGFSFVALNAVLALVLFAYLRSARAPLRLAVTRFDPAAVREILRLGLAASLSPLLSNTCVVVMTGFAGAFGTAAIAGYGIGSRMEYVLIPIAFGFGAALIAIVGRNVGAGQIERAERIAWTGAGIVAAVTGTIGLFFCLWPHAWTALYTRDPAAIDAAALYLRVVGPFYGLFGFGLAFMMASQGTGKLRWPISGSFARVLVAAVGGFIVVRLVGGSLGALFGIVSASFFAYAGVMIVGTLAWSKAARAAAG